MNKIVQEIRISDGPLFQLVHGDLTAETVDAIVNAANHYLKHDGGIAGAIVRRGGATIQTESDEWVRKNGPVAHGKPAHTSAGRLPCRFVIHAVGPIWGEASSQESDENLSAAASASLSLADELDLTSLAVPAISTGIFGFPKTRAAQVIISTIKHYFESHPGSNLKLVRLTIVDQPTLDAFAQAWNDAFPE
jgi:O-acetyl-ADP-ribose deacetylase